MRSRSLGRQSLLLVLCAACHGSSRKASEGGVPSAATPSASTNADVGSHASPSWTEDAEAPAVDTSDRLDGASLRARQRARLAGDASAVVVLQSRDRHAAFDLGRRLCDAVVPRKPPSTPILLKPNLGGFEWFKDPAKSGGDDGLKGRITDPEFVRGVVQCLRARGHDHITVAEGWGAKHADWETLVRVSGYAKMAAEERVPLVAMDDDGVFDVEGDQPGKPMPISGMEATHVPTLLVPRILAETLARGMFISLPKIKAHRYGVLSMSVKGMQGTVDLSDASPAFHQKWRMHREMLPLVKTGKMERGAYVASIEAFAERIADVLEIEAPDVVLAEGAPAMGGDGFEQFWPSVESFAIGGTNPILVDRIGAQMLGLWDNADLARELGGHRTSPLLEAAAKRFGVDLAHPSVTGDGAALLEAARPVHLVGMAGFAIHSDASPPLTPAQLGALGSPGAPLEKPVAHAHPLRDATIAIDGRADDAAWARALPVSFDTDYAGVPTGTTTRARFLYGKGGLYVLWELSGAGLNTDRTRSTQVPRSKLFEEDCVELFFTPDAAHPRRYFETEVGPFGHFLDVSIDLDAGRGGDTTWSSGARIAAAQDAEAHTATMEVNLTAPEIVAALAPGARLPLALYRMEGKSKRLYLAWSPPRTPKPDFHVPAAFGTLVIDP